MIKITNWQSKLFKFIESRQNTPMVWGQTDCLLLIFDCIKLITGSDPDKIKPFRGKYKTPRGGYRLLKKYSGGGLLKTWELIAAEIGMEQKAVNFAQKGDVAVFELESVIGGIREIMGIVLGSVSALQGKDGLVFKNTSQAKKIWSLKK